MSVGGEPASPCFWRDGTTFPAESGKPTLICPPAQGHPPLRKPVLCALPRQSHGQELTTASGFQPSLPPTGLPFFPWGLWACVCPLCLSVPGDLAPCGCACGSWCRLVRSPNVPGSHNQQISGSCTPSSSGVSSDSPRVLMFLGTWHGLEVKIRQRTREDQQRHQGLRTSEMLPPGAAPSDTTARALWARSSPPVALPPMLGGPFRDL